MAMKVTKDVIAGASSITTLYKGQEEVRVFVVENVVGDGYAKLNNAKTGPDIPKIGDPHPSISGIIAKQIVGDGISTDIVTVAVKYGPPDRLQPTPDQVIITVGSSLTTAETNLDVDGNILQTQYTYPDPYDETPHWKGSVLTHAAMVQKLIPTSRASLTRLEDESPLFLSSFYVGRINVLPFLGALAGFWMCTDISGDSQDGGKTYNVTYTFEYKYDTWDQQVVFISSDTGDPPAFATQQELDAGVRTYQIYPAIDFNQLGLG
jgi:hypothetical protein